MTLSAVTNSTETGDLIAMQPPGAFWATGGHISTTATGRATPAYQGGGAGVSAASVGRAGTTGHPGWVRTSTSGGVRVGRGTP